jgi:tryptophan 2,3-dioxygenase
MSDGPARNEGSGGSTAVTYHGYLALSAILDAQHPLAPPELGAQVHAAEHFFIVVHQAFACWNLSQSSRAWPAAPA